MRGCWRTWYAPTPRGTRPVAGDSPGVERIKVLARACQRLLVGGCRADRESLRAETAEMVSMATMCHRSGRAQDDVEPRKLPAARWTVAVAGILLDDLRRLGMEARPR